MIYLEAAIHLRKLIDKANQHLLETNNEGLKEKNNMLIRTNFGSEELVQMDSFSNNFVVTTLKEYANSEACVITDLVSMMQDGKELTYYLFKAYHSKFDKGLVYFQLIDKETLKPIGKLEFSNIEDNIFYFIESPKTEESSCNAIETDENTAKNPCIAFLIGHMDEDRLLYDIQRLIFETANNVQKHKNRKFKFFIQINRFGGKPSPEFLANIDALKELYQKKFKKVYPNSDFIFELDK